MIYLIVAGPWLAKSQSVLGSLAPDWGPTAPVLGPMAFQKGRGAERQTHIFNVYITMI